MRATSISLAKYAWALAASLISLIAGGWLVLAPFALGYQPYGASWTNQTTIAKTVGLSAIALGKLIDAAGLRADGKPTQDALDTGAARVTHNGFGMQVAWHKTQLLLVLRERGQLPIKP